MEVIWLGKKPRIKCKLCPEIVQVHYRRIHLFAKHYDEIELSDSLRRKGPDLIEKAMKDMEKDPDLLMRYRLPIIAWALKKDHKFLKQSDFYELIEKNFDPL
jgi:hypothetical protein